MGAGGTDVTTPEKKDKELHDEGEGEPNALLKRVAVLQNKVKALGLTKTLSEADLKAFMDDQWGEGDHNSHG